jgi:hypothetical protein
LTSVTAGVLLLVAFVAWERRVPMRPLSLFGSAQLTAANVVTFMVYGALNGRAYAWPEACWPPSPSATLVQKADRHSSCCIAL